jgi:hypothetical protein
LINNKGIEYPEYEAAHKLMITNRTTPVPIFCHAKPSCIKLEGWHRSYLAKITKLTIRPKYSLAGIISLIAQCADAYDARAKKAAYDWFKKKLSAT